MIESKARDFMNEMIGKAVNVVLRNGVAYHGKLKAFDIHTNIVLEDCEEVNRGKRRKLNVVFIVGRNLEICLLDE
ncbi:unnamed protein product [marine sediment metagenome]|uniref:Sm domain-containing protein n=1 Tax=marine sediment metagenome TaxID=412755 RepID=X0WPH1_9ZZZZ